MPPGNKKGSFAWKRLDYPIVRLLSPGAELIVVLVGE